MLGSRVKRPFSHASRPEYNIPATCLDGPCWSASGIAGLDAEALWKMGGLSVASKLPLKEFYALSFLFLLKNVSISMS